MTVLSAIQNICPRLGLETPSSVFGSTLLESVQLQRLANDAAKMIAEEHEWQKFKAIHTITGDGTEEDWDLPDDFGWIPNGSHIWSSAIAAPLTQVKSEDEWLRDLVLETPTLVNSWIIYGDQVHIRVALPSASTAKFFYQSNEIVLQADAALDDVFDADTDTFRLDERLLEKAMTYLWKLDRGLAYAQHQDEYAALLEKKIGRDAGPRVIRTGGGRVPRGVMPAYPSRLGGS